MWERFGTDGFTRDTWITVFGTCGSEKVTSQLRGFCRFLERSRRVLGLELPSYQHEGIGGGHYGYAFSVNDVDRLTLIRDLVDRYLVAFPIQTRGGPPCDPTPTDTSPS